MNQYQNNCSCGMNTSMRQNSACNMNQPARRQTPCNMNQPARQQPPCNMNQPPKKPAPCAPACEKKQEPSRPSMSRAQLLNYINEVSFAKDEMILYLDTHPCDEEALEYCRKHVKMRTEALKEYAKFYGPLTIDTTNDAASKSWEWVMQPWPWVNGV